MTRMPAWASADEGRLRQPGRVPRIGQEFVQGRAGFGAHRRAGRHLAGGRGVAHLGAQTHQGGEGLMGDALAKGVDLVEVGIRPWRRAS